MTALTGCKQCRATSPSEQVVQRLESHALNGGALCAMRFVVSQAWGSTLVGTGATRCGRPRAPTSIPLKASTLSQR